jgi:hypothetical protein
VGIAATLTLELPGDADGTDSHVFLQLKQSQRWARVAPTGTRPRSSRVQQVRGERVERKAGKTLGCRLRVRSDKARPTGRCRRKTPSQRGLRKRAGIQVGG